MATERFKAYPFPYIPSSSEIGDQPMRLAVFSGIKASLEKSTSRHYRCSQQEERHNEAFD
jgi:hypothetical protein